jgi:hypothetical protein
VVAATRRPPEAPEGRRVGRERDHGRAALGDEREERDDRARAEHAQALDVDPEAGGELGRRAQRLLDGGRVRRCAATPVAAPGPVLERIDDDERPAALEGGLDREGDALGVEGRAVERDQHDRGAAVAFAVRGRSGEPSVARVARGIDRVHVGSLVAAGAAFVPAAMPVAGTWVCSGISDRSPRRGRAVCRWTRSGRGRGSRGRRSCAAAAGHRRGRAER